MPLHDVKCLKCGHIDEAFWQPTEKPQTLLCNNCDSLEYEVIPGRSRIGFGGSETERKLEQQAAEMGW